MKLRLQPQATFDGSPLEAPKRGKGRPRKSEEPTPIEALRERVRGVTGKGKTISEKEAAELQESLPAALEDDFRYLDEWLWSRQAAVDKDFSEVDKQPVWSNLDEDEIEALTRIMIKGSKKSPAMAAITRAAVDSRDYVVTAAIVVPRAKKTLDIVRKTHRPAKKRGQS